MSIQLTCLTDDLKSVLTLTGDERDANRKVIESMSWQSKHSDLPEMISDAVKSEITDRFGRMVRPLLSDIGLVTADLGKSSGRIYLRDDPGKTYFEVYCKGIKIIPGRDDFLDGFVPKFKFFLNQEKPESLEAICVIEQNGPDELLSLIAPTLLCYLKRPQWLNDRLIIKRDPANRNQFFVAPVTQVGRYLSNMKGVAEIIGENLGKLREIKERISGFSYSETLKEVATNHFAAKLLEFLGVPLEI